MRASLLLLSACQASPPVPDQAAPNPQPHVSLNPVSEVAWTALNPARGEASPRAATLWGDRTTAGPSGFLVKFAEGFSSPPHIHNVSYRALVVSGEVHNDDPSAMPMWMRPGSFWTQPQGEAHITSARGPSVAYVEIDQGPYLVHPPDQAIGGSMLRLLPGSRVRLRSSQDIQAIVIAANLRVQTPQGEEPLPAGSGFTGSDLATHCATDQTNPCLLYLRTAAGMTLASSHP